MIQLENIQFGYVKSRPLFKELSLTMEPGHIYGLLGKNGAGKTTLLKIMSGLRFPDGGSATIMGENASLRKAEVLQNLYFLQEEFAEYLREFELDREFGYMDKLSHGQKKKVLIAFALATNTKVLIMDEPTNGLDIPSKSTFRKLMASAADESRLVIISTHQVRDLHSLIDMVAILDNGHMLLNASSFEITEKLLFDMDNMKSAEGKIFYTEESPRGNYQVKENVNHIDSTLDLELLFNAAISKKNEISNLFK